MNIEQRDKARKETSYLLHTDDATKAELRKKYPNSPLYITTKDLARRKYRIPSATTNPYAPEMQGNAVEVFIHSTEEEHQKALIRARELDKQAESRLHQW